MGLAAHTSVSLLHAGEQLGSKPQHAQYWPQSLGIGKVGFWVDLLLFSELKVDSLEL